jgi:TfoX/Sxy family transcriptional regulator of competence genes
MAYDQIAAQRIREVLTGHSGLTEKEMFGGIGFMFHGNMACGINGNDLILRVGPQRYEQALSEPQAGLFDFTGRPMKGWVKVSSEGYKADADLRAWVQMALDFVATLPEK